MVEDLESAFDKHNEEYLKFERVRSPLHECPDIAAMLKLHSIAPRIGAGSGKATEIIGASAHDEFFFATDAEEFAKNATEDDVIYLIRCGVRFDGDGFCMYA